MTRLSHWLDELHAATEAAASAEQEYRNDFARRVAALADARAVAFRRVNLIRAVAETVAGAEDEETAVAHGLAVVRARLGWSSDSEARSEILTRFAPICEAAFRALSGGDGAETRFASTVGSPLHHASHGPPPPVGEETQTVRAASPLPPGEGDRPKGGGEGTHLSALSDPAAALASFESWYLDTKGSSFWILFENVMPETPLVDF